MSINMDPANARAGVIFGCMGSPSISSGVVVPLTLSEPFAIGVAVMNAEVDAAALAAFSGVSEVLLIPADEVLDVASLEEDGVE